MRRRMFADRRGNVAVIAALAAVPLMLAAGLALDATRLWLVQMRLQAAVDAAVLQAAGPKENPANTAQETIDAGNLFWVDFGRTSRSAGAGGTCSGSVANTGFMGATVCDTGLAVTFPDPTHVQVSATASLPMTFMRLANVSAVPVSASASARHASGVEVALVLDISLSMTFGVGDGTNNTKEQALKTAAQNMLSTLYGAGDAVPNLWISVVPFAGVVNIGSSHTSWLNSSFSSSTFQGSVDTGDGVGWRGCVEARRNGFDLTEDSPATALFAPFYWSSTYHQYSNPSGGYYRGDNEWTIGAAADPNFPVTDKDSYNQALYNTSIPQGPNLGCPHNSVLPLTASKATVSGAINGLTLTNPIGTVVVQGLQWGWFTLSPSWQGSSGWNLTTPQGAALPLSYTAPNNTKVIVLMTDGTSDVSGAETFYGAANKNQSWPPVSTCNQNSPYNNIAPECIKPDSWYSPYGRVSAGRISIDTSRYTGVPASDSGEATRQFSSALDGKFTSLCNAVKAKNIVVYTIFFHGSEDDLIDSYLGANTGSQNGSQSARSLLQGCATDSSHFFDANSSATVNNAFVQIAKQIVDARLTQ